MKVGAFALFCLINYAQAQDCQGRVNSKGDEYCQKQKELGRCTDGSPGPQINCAKACCVANVKPSTAAAASPTSIPSQPSPSASPGPYDGAIIVPDQKGKRVLILDSDTGKVLWEYKASGVVARLFNSRWSDAKVERINGKDYILFCGSGSQAVAMVSVDTKQVVFTASVGKSPHSIAMLPGGNILVVDTGGNSHKGELFVFDSTTGRLLDRKLTGKYTHGAVWMTSLNKLYSAPGGQVWGYDQTTGKLTLEKTGAWRSECNHDVMPGMTQDELICTGGNKNAQSNGVHSYSAKNGPKPVFVPNKGTKGADIRRSDGKVIYVLGVTDSRDDKVRYADGRVLQNSAWFFYKAHFYQTNIMLPDISRRGFPGSAGTASANFDYSEEDKPELNGSNRRVWASIWCFLLAPLLLFLH